MKEPRGNRVGFVRFAQETLRRDFLRLRSKQVFGESRLGPRKGELV